MKMASKPQPPPRRRRRTEETDVNTEIERLARENERLRRQVRALQHLREAVYRDSVTGLRNRRYFEERLDEEVRRLSRNPDRVGSLLLVDVDDFKQINDEHGHMVGDGVLREVALIMGETLRLEDVCCRFGGDEFVVILPETGAEGAARVVARLTEALDHRNRTAAFSLYLSVGHSTWPTDGIDAHALLSAADRDMYASKRNGKRARTPVPPAPRLTLV